MESGTESMWVVQEKQDLNHIEAKASLRNPFNHHICRILSAGFSSHRYIVIYIRTIQ